MRVATLNLRRDFDRWPERLPLVAEVIAREQPHLIGLQEVGIRNRQGQAIAEAVNKILHLPAYTFWLQRKPHWRYQFIEGLGILARVPVIDHRRLTLSWRGWMAQRVQVDWDGQPVDFVNVHLPPRPPRRPVRQAMARRVLRWLDGAERTILVGDFNDLPDSSPVQTVAGEMRSAYAEACGAEPAWTWPTPLIAWHGRFSAVLDYVFVKGPFKVQAARVAFDEPHATDAKLWPSDHLGLIVDLQ